MKYLLLAIALASASCFATSGDLESAVADITGRIDVVARDAQESAEAAREAWKRGEIDYAELQKRLQDIRAATLDSAGEITREVIDGVKDTIENRPEVVGQVAGEAAGAVIPGPLGQILEMLLVAGGTYFAAAQRSKAQAKEEAARVNRERDAARVVRGEPTGGQVATP